MGRTGRGQPAKAGRYVEAYKLQPATEEGAEAVSIQARPELDGPPEGPVSGTASNRPSQRYQSLGYRGKRVLLGPPLKTSQLVNERITKRVALVVFSYRQVIDAYPSAGGAYVVSRDNFGNVVASVAGAALLIDYILTVAVSVSSGVGNMISAFGPDNPLVPWQVEIAIGFIVLLAWGNLRGIREAGRIFAIPTYLYVVSMGAMVGMGIVRVLTGSLDNVSYSAADQAGLIGHGQAVEAVTLFLVLRAFASGTTALTGVEAVSNGVSAFRRPEARNAKTTLLVMAFIMGSLFLGISFLAGHLGIKPFQDEVPTVVAQLGQHVLGSSPLGHAFFLLTQGATLMILVLDANTSFSGFPLLASFAAGDALLPRQLRKRGHRLVYSNGILVLSAVAILLVMAFHASTSALIPLYAIGVVISFTLSQAGMTKRHWKLRERGWRYGLVVNGVGSVVTLVVLMVIVVAKFTAGAWMVCLAVPLLVLFLLRTQKTYRSEVKELKVEASQRLAPPKPRHEVVVLVEDLDQATLAALQYARQLNPLSITAVHIAIDPDHARELSHLWSKVQIPVPLEVVDAPDRNLLATVEETVAERVRPDTEVSVLLPKRSFSNFWNRILHDRTALGIFKVLGEMDNVNVTIVPFRLGRRGASVTPIGPSDGQPKRPVRAT